jgi:glycosyltransferase involved in cell wall biosynthesis
MKTKRIAFISTIAAGNWGGSEELWSQAAARLKLNGHEVFVNVKYAGHASQKLKAIQTMGCQIEMRAFRNVLHRSVMRLFPGQFAPVDQNPRRFEWLDRIHPDLVVLSEASPFTLTAWMKACADRSIPYVALIHGVSETSWPSGDVTGYVQNYENAVATCFVSRAARSWVEKQLAHEISTACVVFNPFNASFDTTPTWPQEKDEVRIACVGSLNLRMKGQDMLLDILARDKWRHRPVKLSLFGDGPDKELLHRMKNKHQLENVEFPGYVSDIATMWSNHHALVMSSRSEGLPMSLVEAMLCHRMAIVTNVAGCAEFIVDGVNGFVAPAPAVQLIEETMERAWNARFRWREMGEAAGRHIRKVVPADPAARFAEQLLGLKEWNSNIHDVNNGSPRLMNIPIGPVARCASK